jgi:polyhydroxybutyrate depolymerase
MDEVGRSSLTVQGRPIEGEPGGRIRCPSRPPLRSFIGSAQQLATFVSMAKPAVGLLRLLGAVTLLAACSGNTAPERATSTSSTATSTSTTPGTQSASTTEAGGSTYRPGSQVITLDVRGTPRTAVVVVPKDVTTPAPLVLAFHGHGGSGRQLDRQMGFEELWPDAIVVYPDGLAGHPDPNDPTGARTGWQFSRGETGDEDIAFFDALVADLQAHLPVDPDRLYLMGHSNGSFFVSLLAAERGGLMAATANSSGAPSRLIAQGPARSMFFSMGRNDPVVPYSKQFAALPVARQKLGIDPATATTDGFLTTARGTGGLELAVYDHPGGHEPPAPIAALIVSFFQRHTRSGG